MKNKKLIGSLVVMVFLMMFLGSISNIKNLNNSPKIAQETISDGLIPVNFSINIGDIYIGDNNPDWSYYVDNYDWCSGAGSEEDPYIIEGIHVTNENMSAHISIETAEYFIIRNVTVSNYAKPYGHHIFAGIYIGKGEYGLIDNCTIINCSHGISLAEAKDSLKITNCKFIGSHNDTDTGLGCAILIHEAKGVNISYNDIYNYYTGIVIYDAEDISIENNTIQTNFGYTSQGGIYFCGVNDSIIVNNSLYGCEFGGHEYTEPKTSSDEFPILLESCYNVEVYGNRFYDLDGNLIVSDVPDVPEGLTNYWYLIFGIIFVISGVIITIYSFWRTKIKKSDK